ncbi:MULTISPECIES: hypothetical protein [Halorussus]|uniref:DUF7344 domain-containing protein n=1 Tax=Halorussus TaxID=1070314 RepID=UPI000E21825F|nr:MULTISPECIES: hypothetical protein [Halorussus]NHN58935.1 hypothetical protein [Halorussus sp. JP-T4]
MRDNPSEATAETGTATTEDAAFGGHALDPEPTADLRTGEARSEKLDAAFELLADPVRREALRHLGEADEDVLGLAALADAVAAGRSDDAVEARSLAVELHHAHLPKLESHGVAAYDPERRTVEYRGREWLDEWVDHVRQVDST